MLLEKEPLVTLMLRNRGKRPFTIRRAKSGLEISLDEFAGMGLKIYKTDPFISIDLENRTIWMDMGSDD